MTAPVHNIYLSKPLPDAELAGCWERLVEFQCWPGWNPRFGKVACKPAGGAGRGSVLEIDTASGARQSWEIVHWEPRVKLAFIMRHKLHQCSWCFEFPADSAPDKRGLRLAMELQCGRGARWLGWWFRWRLRRNGARFIKLLCAG